MNRSYFFPADSLKHLKMLVICLCTLAFAFLNSFSEAYAQSKILMIPVSSDDSVSAAMREGFTRHLRSNIKKNGHTLIDAESI
jgi:hypothetical protein